MAALRDELIVGSLVIVLRGREHDAIGRRLCKDRVHVQNTRHGDGERTDKPNQALTAQELHETQSHNLTRVNFAVHGVSAGPATPAVRGHRGSGGRCRTPVYLTQFSVPTVTSVSVR